MPFKNNPEELVQKKVSHEKFEGNVLFESPGMGIQEVLKENNLRDIDRVIAENIKVFNIPEPRPELHYRKRIREPEPTFRTTIYDFFKLMKQVDWGKVKEELGGSLKSLGIAIVAFGDRELVNIDLPNIEKLSKGYEKLISELPQVDQEKIKAEIAKMQAGLREKFKKEKPQSSPNQEKVGQGEKRTSANEINKRASLEQAINDLSDLLNKTVDPETRRKIRSIISTISVLLATLPLLSGSSQISNKAEAQNIYGDIYGNIPSEEKSPERKIRREIPDEGVVSDKVDILKGIKISNAEDSLELFGARLGSKIGIAGENIITIENKSDDRGSSIVMKDRERMGDFVIVTKDADDKRVFIDLKNYTTEINGDIALDLNNLPEEILYSIANGHLIWGDFEYKNGVATSSFVQRGEITGIKDEAQSLLNKTIMNRILKERNKNII